MSVSQSARSVLMVSPASFGFDEETADSNSFQVRPELTEPQTINHAMHEFDAAVDKLRQANIDVIVYHGDPSENKPDAVFPNNWITTWPSGDVFLYPMAAANRRLERDKRVIELLAKRFAIADINDLSASEAESRYLESTGAIVFDHITQTAYGCRSSRCDEELFTEHVAELGYKPIVFEAFDQTGVPIYHTNVMMGVQSSTAVICSEAIADNTSRQAILESLGADRHVIDITFEQMGAFCGNLLEVENTYGNKILVMSQSAYNAFTDQQLDQLSVDKTIVSVDIPTIEQAGGGSARCMLAEIFLPPLASTTQPAGQTSHQPHA